MNQSIMIVKFLDKHTDEVIKSVKYYTHDDLLLVCESISPQKINKIIKELPIPYDKHDLSEDEMKYLAMHHLTKGFRKDFYIITNHKQLSRLLVGIKIGNVEVSNDDFKQLEGFSDELSLYNYFINGKLKRYLEDYKCKKNMKN